MGSTQIRGRIIVIKLINTIDFTTIVFIRINWCMI